MLDYSIGEIESLVLKAYRGAGFSWGMAQEAGSAAGWLSENRFPAIDLFANLLEQTDGCSHANLLPGCLNNTTPELVCPVVAGCALTDGILYPDELMASGGATIEAVVSPLILLAFAARYADIIDHAISVVCGEQSFYCERGNALPLLADSGLLAKSTVTMCRVNHRELAAPASVTRGSGKSESIALLESLAHRTYVPASEASRLAGAGAGLLDND